MNIAQIVLWSISQLYKFSLNVQNVNMLLYMYLFIKHPICLLIVYLGHDDDIVVRIRILFVTLVYYVVCFILDKYIGPRKQNYKEERALRVCYILESILF